MSENRRIERALCRIAGVVATLLVVVTVPSTSVSGAAVPVPVSSNLGRSVRAAVGGTQPVALAAPYEYLGWGDPQPPADVLSTTGIHDLTLAFILAHKGCNPEWDGSRPLLGGSDAAAIAAVRSAGGDVDVSVGGWSGSKLGAACKTVAGLRAAYQEVVDDYDFPPSISTSSTPSSQRRPSVSEWSRRWPTSKMQTRRSRYRSPLAPTRRGRMPTAGP